MKELDKLYFLKKISDNGVKDIGKTLSKEIKLFYAKHKMGEDRSILDAEGIKDTYIYYIMKHLLDGGYIYENYNKFDEENRIGLTEKGKYELEKNKKFINIIELYARDYPFIFALGIGFTGGLGATVLNLFFK